MKKALSLDQKLKALDPQVKKYISELAKQNTRLEMQIAKCQAKQVSLNSRIKALERQWKLKKIDIRYNLGFPPRSLEPDAALIGKMGALLKKMSGKSGR